MRILFISGAPLGATGGGQRYEQLYKCALKDKEVEPYFYCPFVRSTQDIPICDVVVVGFPLGQEHLVDISEQHFHVRCIVYDVCDAWYDEMVEGVSFKDAHNYWLNRADIVTVVNPRLAQNIHSESKPIFLLPNALRTDFPLQYQTNYDDDAPIRFFFWGSYYTGQNWWDLDAILQLAEMLPDAEFHIYLASNLTNPFRKFPFELPSNLHVSISWHGASIHQIVQDVMAMPAKVRIGLIPYKPCEVAYCADPIKVYEYLALNMTVLVTNWSFYGLNELAFDRVVSGYGVPIKVLERLYPLAIEKAIQSQKRTYNPCIPTFDVRWSELKWLISQIV